MTIFKYTSHAFCPCFLIYRVSYYIKVLGSISIFSPKMPSFSGNIQKGMNIRTLSVGPNTTIKCLLFWRIKNILTITRKCLFHRIEQLTFPNTGGLCLFRKQGDLFGIFMASKMWLEWGSNPRIRR